MDIGQEKLPDLTYLSIYDSDYKFSKQSIQLLSRCVCDVLGIGDFELSISFVDQDAIQNLNAEYRQKNQPTDVLSFPQTKFAVLPSYEKPHFSEEPTASGVQSAPKTLGDIVLCPEVAAINAQRIGQTLQDEICFLITHGVLHLCGYDHEDTEDEAFMLKQQHSIIKHLKKNFYNHVKGILKN